MKGLSPSEVMKRVRGRAFAFTGMAQAQASSRHFPEQIVFLVVGRRHSIYIGVILSVGQLVGPSIVIVGFW